MVVLPANPSRPWASTGSPRAALAGEVEADVAVVGGGIAGLTVAVLLARAGARVRVLEAGRVGQGTTGASTAKVTALQGLRLSELRRHHGDHVLEPYAAAQLAALAWITDRARQRRVACDLERRTATTYVVDPRQRDLVEAEAAAAEVASLPVRLAEEAEEMPFPTGPAVLLPDQAQLDPQAWLEDLADEVAAAPGCAVHEASAVVGFADRHRTVVTEHGRVRAGHVVLATLLPISDRGLFFARAEPAMSHGVAMVATGPVPSTMSYGADEPTRSLRTRPDGDGTLLLVGGEGHVVGREADTLGAQRRLVEWACDRFPVGEVVHRWAAHDLRPVDLLPWAGRADHLPGSPWIATGFGKWGLTNGTAAAMTLARGILGGDPHPWDEAFSPHRNPGWPGSRSLVGLNLGVAREMAAGWAAPGTATTQDGPEVGRCGGVPCADESGGSRVSLRCTHLGGIVRWNAAERTWDCPLHGSRFTSDGTVVAGPAVRPLRVIRRPPS